MAGRETAAEKNRKITSAGPEKQVRKTYRNPKEQSQTERMHLKRRKMKKIKKSLVRAGTLTFIFCLGILIGNTAKANEASAKPEPEVKVRVINAQITYPSTENIPGKNSPFLILVNKDNPLSADYEVELVPLKSGRGKAAEAIYEDLNEMLKDGGKEGLSFCVASAHRSRERQQELVDEDVAALMRKGLDYEEAYGQVIRQTMPAGYSEHETGLAVDIVAVKYQMLDEQQEKTKENKWLRENCHKYGFILRYPKGKEDITGVDYESWHFRYVGREAAEYIMENGLTLEEYLDKIRNGQVVKQISRAVW